MRWAAGRSARASATSSKSQYQPTLQWHCPSKSIKLPDAKPLRGFGGAGVLELIDDHRGDTYRAVYTVRFATKIYVQHVFQKKSKRGIATPKRDLELIRERLKWAERLHTGKTKDG